MDTEKLIERFPKEALADVESIRNLVRERNVLRSALDRYSLLLDALKLDKVKVLTCPTCGGEGRLFKQANDGDLIPDCACPDCDGAGELRVEDF